MGKKQKHAAKQARKPLKSQNKAAHSAQHAASAANPSAAPQSTGTSECLAKDKKLLQQQAQQSAQITQDAAGSVPAASTDAAQSDAIQSGAVCPNTTPSTSSPDKRPPRRRATDPAPRDTVEHAQAASSRDGTRLGLTLAGMVLCAVAGLIAGTQLPPQWLESLGLRTAPPHAPLEQPPAHAIAPESASGQRPIPPQAVEIPAGAHTPVPPMPPAPKTLAERVALLEKQVQAEPDNSTLWADLGNGYFDLNKPSKAIHAYEQVLRLKPDNATVLTDLGIMYRETGRYEKAVQAFDKAVLHSPNQQNALFNSGVVLYFDLGRKKEARKRWAKLLQVNPLAQAPDGTPVKDLLRTLK